MEQLLQCPNCSAVWGMEEIDWQCCDACGYPLSMDTEYDDFGPDDDPDNDPNK